MSEQLSRLWFRTALRREARDLYRAVLDPRNLVAEMRPWIAMANLPELGAGQTYNEVPVGVKLADCPIRLFGVVPVDTWELSMESITPPDAPDGTPLRFVEASRTRMMKSWRHTREVTALPSEPDGPRALIEDRLEIETKVPLLQAPTVAFVRQFFRHRHARMKSIYEAKR